jgi:hypothetical protein
MTVWVWLGLAGLVVAGTVAICFAGALLVILADGLWESWALWRTRRALARDRRDLDVGAPPGV